MILYLFCSDNSCTVQTIIVLTISPSPHVRFPLHIRSHLYNGFTKDQYSLKFSSMLSMCGRFCIAVAPGEIRERYSLSHMPDVSLPSYNITVSNVTPVITCTHEEHFSGKMAIWGYQKRVQSHIRRISNLRSETIEKTVSLLERKHTSRCLIPATGFYEWKQEKNKKIPYFIRKEDGTLFSMAGLVSDAHNDSNPYPSYVILTCQSAGGIHEIHDRMPVIIARDKEMQYFCSDTKRAVSVQFEQMKADIRNFFAYPVSLAVNNPENNYLDLINPVDYPDPNQQRLL